MDVSSFQTKLQNFSPLRRTKLCLALKSLFTKHQMWTYCFSKCCSYWNVFLLFQSKHPVMWMPVFFNSLVPWSTSLHTLHGFTSDTLFVNSLWLVCTTYTTATVPSSTILYTTKSISSVSSVSQKSLTPVWCRCSSY